MNGNNFLVGPIGGGLNKGSKPWATPEDSFETLINAYQFRGRLIRRTGYTTLGRLSFQISSQVVAASAQNFTNLLFTTFSLAGVVIVANTLTITVNGGANYILEESPIFPGNIIKVSGAGAAFLNGSINYLTGLLTLNFSSNPGGNVVITFSYAYGLPVMGLRTRELFSINAQDTIGFDTKYAYRYSNTLGQFQPLPSVMPVVWSGADWQFFFTTNYAGAFWATNSVPGLHGAAINGITQNVIAPGQPLVSTALPHGFTTGQTVVFINVSGMTRINGLSSVITVQSPTTFSLNDIDTSTFGVYSGNGFALNSYVSVSGQDGIRYYGELNNGTGWANYNPPIDPNNALAGALMIFPYRGYLVFLNTTEGNEQGTFNYGNRARWIAIGTPYYSLPVPVTPSPQTVDRKQGRDDLFGRGGAYDAPTQEVIVSAAFVRDVLVVFFERSVWRLRFVNNSQNPFVWERINVELGASAPFSAIPFDKGVMAIGERGIVISDSNDILRFDEKIPDTVFDIRIENNGMERVYGIRTFRTKLSYWTFPSDENANGIYPDQVLVYNYETKNWSFFDDCFTCFGYFYQFDDATWADLINAWSFYGNQTWGGGEIEKGFESILAGNQQGYVLQLENSDSQNEQSLYITAISGSTFTSPNNNLPDGTWIKLTGIAGITDITLTPINGRNFKVVNSAGPAAQPNTFTLQEWTPIDAGIMNLNTFSYTLAVPFIPIYPGSVYIRIAGVILQDFGQDGILQGSDGVSTGTINYTTGALTVLLGGVVFNTHVYVRVVSKNPLQAFSNVVTTGTYTGGGEITKISNINITSKIFNFIPKDKRARLSKIDFYLNQTSGGQFTCDVLADSSNVAINKPLGDNLQSNVVLSTRNPYQVAGGEETIYRLFCDAIAQTLQVKFYLSESQIAVDPINTSDIEILGLNFTMRPGGRLV